AGSLVFVANHRTGETKRYGYDATDPHRLTLAVRSNGTNQAITYGTTPTVSPVVADLGGPAQFAGLSQQSALDPGGADLYAFRGAQQEPAPTATGHLIVRVVVQADGSNFVPGTPTVAGLTALSVKSVNGQVVALFEVDRPGLYAVRIAGADGQTSGNYKVEL